MATCAEWAGISKSTWRLIERGWRWVRKGEAETARASADKVAAAAEVLNVNPEELRAAGRPDAADLLARRRAEATPTAPRDMDDADIDLSRVPNAILLDEVRRRMVNEPAAYPPLRAVARRVTPSDTTTFEQDVPE